MQASRKIRDGAASGTCKRGGGLVADRLLDGAGAEVPALAPHIVAFALARFAEKARVRYAYEATAREFPTAGITEAQVRAVGKIYDIQMERGPEKGKGVQAGGRPKGSRDTKPRKPRASKWIEVWKLHIANPQMTQEQIGDKLGIGKAAVSKHIKKGRPPEELLR